MSQQVIVCEPRQDCDDPNINRWYCMRGHALPEEDKPAVAGVCHLPKCGTL